jgi:hypothetical protein
LVEVSIRKKAAALQTLVAWPASSAFSNMRPPMASRTAAGKKKSIADRRTALPRSVHEMKNLKHFFIDGRPGLKGHGHPPQRMPHNAN